jgi:hypothetical protein
MVVLQAKKGMDDDDDARRPIRKIGQGVSGCVVRPPVPCAHAPDVQALIDARGAGLVGKISTASLAQATHNTLLATLRKLDPDEKMFVLTMAESCEPDVAAIPSECNMRTHEDLVQTLQPFAGKALADQAEPVPITRDVLVALTNVAQGVAVMANAGLIHNDLEFRNVVVAGDTARIIDFDGLNTAPKGHMSDMMRFAVNVMQAVMDSPELHGDENEALARWLAWVQRDPSVTPTAAAATYRAIWEPTPHAGWWRDPGPTQVFRYAAEATPRPVQGRPAPPALQNAPQYYHVPTAVDQPVPHSDTLLQAVYPYVGLSVAETGKCPTAGVANLLAALHDLQTKGLYHGHVSAATILINTRARNAMCLTACQLAVPFDAVDVYSLGLTPTPTLPPEVTWAANGTTTGLDALRASLVARGPSRGALLPDGDGAPIAYSTADVSCLDFYAAATVLAERLPLMRYNTDTDEFETDIVLQEWLRGCIHPDPTKRTPLHAAIEGWAYLMDRH